MKIRDIRSKKEVARPRQTCEIAAARLPDCLRGDPRSILHARAADFEQAWMCSPESLTYGEGPRGKDVLM